MNPIPYGYTFAYRTLENEDERLFPVIPFLTGLAVAPFLYGALHPGGYYSYPPPTYFYHNQYYGYPPYYNEYY